MAEVIDYWPESRRPPAASFSYPWEQWMALDENGHGDIWLAELGIDWAEDSNVANFRNTLYTRANNATKRRKRDAPLVLKRVGDKVRRVPDFRPLKVRIRIVSDTQVAFQYYDSEEPPPAPIARKVAVPTKNRGGNGAAKQPHNETRRRNIHRRVTGSTLQRST